MLFTFLLVVQFIVAALLVTVILMQRSEGGGLASGGSPSGLMSARGASDFLTRSTAILAALFIGLCILLAVLAAGQHSSTVDTRLQQQPQTAPAVVPSPAVPFAAPGNESGAAPGNLLAPVGPANDAAAPAGNAAVPLAQ